MFPIVLLAPLFCIVGSSFLYCYIPYLRESLGSSFLEEPIEKIGNQLAPLFWKERSQLKKRKDID